VSVLFLFTESKGHGMFSRIIPLVFILMFIAACSSPTPEPTATPVPATAQPTIAPSSTPEPTTAPTFTPMPVEDLAGLELLSGSPDTCINAEDYGAVLAFQAHSYETTTENRITYRLLDADGNVLSEETASGENKDGEEGWGFYPLAYEVPENSLLTVEVTVYASDEEDAAATSHSVLVYNCTTGETVEATFTRNP
jgi:hypothetical protein